MAYTNPATGAMPYINQIPGATAGYYQPYVNAGNQALPQLQNQYGSLFENLPQLQNQYSSLTNHPGEMLNQIGHGYQESPGLNFAIQRALQGAGHAAAAGGMAGSPQHEEQNIGLTTNYANQDYNNWLTHALGLYEQGLGGQQGLYGAGLSGEQGLASGGLQAGSNLADMIAQTLAQQGQLSYTGQQNVNQLNNAQKNAKWNAIGQGAGALASFLPFNAIGKTISGLFGGQ